MLQAIVDTQRDIYLAFAEHIKTFANGGGWTAFFASCRWGSSLARCMR
ncbi:hypothetical protein AOX55_00005934 (plasmid) [Sinorhizobium fredii CCBAU 25509]|nr:hypothetical protein AOX55_00005934 [Sinorhizobium fredii CCBAU 25509]